MSKTVTTRLDEQSVEKLDELAARKGVDRAALLRSFFMYALKDHLLRDSLEDYQAGKISLWEASQRCNLSLWEMIRELQNAHVHMPYDLPELRKDLMRIDGGNG